MIFPNERGHWPQIARLSTCINFSAPIGFRGHANKAESLQAFAARLNNIGNAKLWTRRARDEMAGIEEELDEAEIRELREEAKDSIEKAAKRTGDVADGHVAKRAIERVGDR